MKSDSSPRLASPSAFRLLPYVLFAISLLASGGLWWYASASASAKDQLLFERRVVQARATIVSRIDQQITLLRATAAAIAVDPQIGRNEFHRFARTLEIGDDQNGVMGIGFAKRLAPNEVDGYERSMRAQGLPRFRVFPNGVEGDRFPISLLEPQTTRNLSVLGFDMHSESIRRLAMDAARDTGDPVATGKVVLLQDQLDHPQPGFLVYVPVYSDAETPSTVVERRSAIIGFAYSPLRASDFFGRVLEGGQGPDVSVEIYSKDARGTDKLLYARHMAYLHAPRAMRMQTQAAHVAGVDWILKFSAPSYAEAVGTEFIIWIPFVGLIVSLLIYLLVSGQVQTLAASQRQAADATRRAERQRFLAEAGRILANPQDPRRMLDDVAALAVPQFADWCAVDLPAKDGGIDRASVRHVEPAKVRVAKELWERYPMDLSSARGVPKVLREGRPIFVPRVTEAMLRADATDEDHWNLLRSLNIHSVLSVPMNVRGETIGAITFVSSDPSRVYDAEDLGLAEDLGARVAVALDNAKLFEATQREVGERRRAEAMVRELNANLERLVDERTKELRASNRELEAFCYSVSHDLRTPLRSLDGFSKALLEDFGSDLPDEGREYLDRVRAATRRMDELITALLTLSRLTRAEINREGIDVTSIAQGSAFEATRDVPEEKVEVTIQPGMVANADARMVRIVFDNLIGNAIKFSGPRERQEIEVGRRYGAFFVRDNGVGFNPEYSSKLFAPFERLHSPREFPGSGIGLATVQRIVQRHGGDVWAESDVGKGATFYFTLE